VSADTVKVLSPVDAPRVDAFDPGADGTAQAIVWPGEGAVMRVMHRLVVGAGASTRELRHPGEAVYYVISGQGSVRDGGSGEDTDIVEGSMVHVEPGTAYAFRAGEAGPLELVGGPGPADPDAYRQEV
jgi:mannose-6-phosphate isomerase-like protein (cupin superfamily)